MTVETMKNTTFEKADFLQWKKLAEQSLKGKPYESLLTETLEGINLQPLYAKEANPKNTAIIQSMKGETGWMIAQQTAAIRAADFIDQLTESLEKGNEAILYDGAHAENHPLDWQDEHLIQLAALLSAYPVYLLNVKSNDPILRAFDFVHHEVRGKVRGIVHAKDWILPVGYKNLRTVGIDLWGLHHEGADAVTELAISLAKASQLAERAESFEAFAQSFFVRFAIDTHFFMEIAKLRAFRLLWKAFSEAFGIEEEPKIPVMAITSIRSFSKLDPYVNLLRAGNETFAAVLGGADIITTHPHDVLTGTTQSSIRYSRNIQLVLKEETSIDKVLDPAGGSYFIEQLTDDLVEKAWNLFLDIHSAGGPDIYLQSGKIREQLEKRKYDVATGNKSLIGTNVYAEIGTTTFGNSFQQTGRLAEPFEKLRESHVEQPKTVLVTMGQLKDYKPRADFVTGFLAAGGISCVWSPSMETVQEAADWLKSERPDYAVVCAPDAITPSVVESLLKDLPEGIILDVAGQFDKEVVQQWQLNGLNGTIFKGQNSIEKLQSIYDSWGGNGK